MATTCSNCTNEVPPGMPTCGWCGASLDGAEARETVSVHEPERHVFGVPPATGLLVLGTLILALAVYLLLTGTTLIGALLLVAGLFVLSGFPAIARRHDETPVARRAVRSYDGVRGRAEATIASLAAKAAARRELGRIDSEMEQLQRSRSEALGKLGEAALARDETEMERLRGEIASADTALESKRTERDKVLTDTDERVEDARLRAQPTERLEREEVAADTPVQDSPGDTKIDDGADRPPG